MKTITENFFDTVKFFSAIKEKLAAKMADITLEQQKDFLRQVREGKIKIVYDNTCNFCCYASIVLVSQF